MTRDHLTLYKLIVLYMLERVTFPLTKAQIGDFVLEKEYTDFLTLQQAVSELEDAGLINAKSLNNRTHLEITEEGKETLHFFENRISDAIKEDIGEYFKEHALELRNEVSVTANYYKSVQGEFEADLSIQEKGTQLIAIKLSVPTQELAIAICDSWQEKNQEIYQYLMERLF